MKFFLNIIAFLFSLVFSFQVSVNTVFYSGFEFWSAGMWEDKIFKFTIIIFLILSTLIIYKVFSLVIQGIYSKKFKKIVLGITLFVLSFIVFNVLVTFSLFPLTNGNTPALELDPCFPVEENNYCEDVSDSFWNLHRE